MSLRKILLVIACVRAGLAAPAMTPNRRLLSRADALSPESSCSALPKDDFTSSLYDEVDSHNHLQYYLNNHPDENSLLLDFANQIGIGQSMSSCLITGPCPRPDCQAIDDPDGKETAAAYNGVVSMANVFTSFHMLWDALSLSQDTFNTLQVSLQQTYWPGMPDDSDDSKWFSAASTAFAVISCFFESPIVGAAIEVASAVVDGMQSDVDTQDKSLGFLAQAETNVNDWIESIRGTLYDWYDGFKTTGEHNGVKLIDVMAGGAYLDYRQIPILSSVKITDLQHALFTHLLANMVNYAWKQQNVVLISFPMTEDEFNTNVADAGTNDFRLKSYYGGRGWFFQSWKPVTYLSNPNVPLVQNPPGWGELGGQDIDLHDIIRSSADAYHAGGFDFDQGAFASDLVKKGPGDIQLPAVGLPGVFTIPECHLDASDKFDTKDFYKILNAPGKRANAFYGERPSFCWCLDLVDQNGKKFSDVPGYDFKGMKDYC